MVHDQRTSLEKKRMKAVKMCGQINGELVYFTLRQCPRAGAPDQKVARLTALQKNKSTRLSVVCYVVLWYTTKRQVMTR